MNRESNPTPTTLHPASGKDAYLSVGRKLLSSLLPLTLTFLHCPRNHQPSVLYTWVLNKLALKQKARLERISRSRGGSTRRSTHYGDALLTIPPIHGAAAMEKARISGPQSQTMDFRNGHPVFGASRHSMFESTSRPVGGTNLGQDPNAWGSSNDVSLGGMMRSASGPSRRAGAAPSYDIHRDSASFAPASGQPGRCFQQPDLGCGVSRACAKNGASCY